jgi:hypothetical protein
MFRYSWSDELIETAIAADEIITNGIQVINVAALLDTPGGYRGLTRSAPHMRREISALPLISSR